MAKPCVLCVSKHFSRARFTAFIKSNGPVLGAKKTLTEQRWVRILSPHKGKCVAQVLHLGVQVEQNPEGNSSGSIYTRYLGDT